MTTSNAIEAIIPLLPSQQGIYVESHGQAAQYSSQQRIELQGQTDPDRLDAAWFQTCLAHQALRASIRNLSGHLVQVVSTTSRAATVQVFDLSAISADGQDLMAREICDEELRRGFDLAGGPLARLALIRFSPHQGWLCLTHHHIALDGRSLRLIFDDLARRYEGSSPPTLEGPSLTSVMRALRLLSGPAPNEPVAAPHHMSAFHPADRPPNLAASSASAEAVSLYALASEHGLTPAALVIASWLMALARMRDTPDVVCAISRDIRPAQLRNAEMAIGMFAETRMLGISISPSSELTGVARQVQASLTGKRPFPPLSDALPAMWRSGASGRPDTLITIYSGTALPDPPAGLSWRLLDAHDRTEFAADVTISLASVAEICLCTDTNRVDHSVADFLLRGMRALLLNPAAPLESPGTRRIPLPAGQMRLTVESSAQLSLVATIASNILGRKISPDENLLMAGADSLALIAFVSALLEVGWEISVAELMEYCTIQGILPRLRARRPRGIAPPAGSVWTADPSPIESGWLDRTVDPSLGLDPMHEQSALGFSRRLDAGRFTDAVLRVLAHLPSLDRCWEGTAPNRLAYRHGLPPDFEVTRINGDLPVREAVRSLVQSDSRRPFTPDGTPLLRFTLAEGTDLAVLLLSFHYTLLDGWSFATFVRAIQAAYSADSDRVMIGTDSGAYRSWCNNRPSGHGPWADALRGGLPMPRIESSTLRPARTSRTAQIPAVLVDHVSRRWNVTAAVVIQAAAIEACCEVLQQPRDALVGLRVSLRDGSPQAEIRTVGQLTADIPVLPGRGPLSALAEQVAQAIRLSYDWGHLGEAGFRSLVGCGEAELLMHTVIVVENYYQFDEQMIRRLDRSAWPEAFSWRRDVMGAPRTIYLNEHAGSWTVEISTLIDPDANHVTRTVADRIAKLLEVSPGVSEPS